MRKQRQRSRKGESASAQSRRESTVPEKAQGKPARRLVLVFLGLAIALSAWLWRTNSSAPQPPHVPIAQLDTESAQLVELYLKGVRAQPRSGDAWGELGSLLRALDLNAEARRCFDVAERLNPTEPRWPYLHALVLATDSSTPAIGKLRRAVELCGNDPLAPRLRLANTLAEAGQWDEAERELKELLRTSPDYAPALLALAHVAQARGQWAEAAALAAQCVNDRFTARAAWSLLGMAHLRNGDTNAARQANQQAAALPPDAPVPDPFNAESMELHGNPRYLSSRAAHLLSARRADEAAPLIDRLVRDHPTFSEGWLLLGRKQFLEKNTDAALQSIRRHLELDPQSTRGLFQFGMVLLAQERFDDAASAFARAIQTKPDFGPAYYNLGLALAKAGHAPQAVPAFREAIRHSPERLDSYIWLTDLLLQLGQKREAAEVLRQAEGLSAADPRLRALRQKLTRE